MKYPHFPYARSLSRYKLKFSPEKVDTMIVQAIGLLDDLDKEINTYGMRVKEWYGWHFPEVRVLVAGHVFPSLSISLALALYFSVCVCVCVVFCYFCCFSMFFGKNKQN